MQCIVRKESYEQDENSDDDLSDSSQVSSCPSWMLEDLEGPDDDDIFASRSPDHARKLFKHIRNYLKKIRKKGWGLIKDLGASLK